MIADDDVKLTLFLEDDFEKLLFFSFEISAISWIETWLLPFEFNIAQIHFCRREFFFFFFTRNVVFVEYKKHRCNQFRRNILFLLENLLILS